MYTEEVKKFHEKQGVVPDADGWYDSPRNPGKIPVTDEQFLLNISANMEREQLDILKPVRHDPRTFVMCCGGPSLADFLDDIREKSLDPNYLVVCSNMTGGYLLENGIVPNVHFILDAQPKKALDVAPGCTHADTEYWLGLNIDVSVADTLLEQGRRIKYFFCASNIGGERLDEARLRECMTKRKIREILAVGGGTMAGLRAINIAEGLGFRKFEYYGFDGSIRGLDACYAYDKTRKEMSIEVKTQDGETFQSTTILADQATQFLEWERRLAWIDFKIYGDGFIAAMQKCQRDIDRKADPQIDLLITPEYAALQKQMHDSKEHYGTSGTNYADSVFMIACKMSKGMDHVDILDYGCGKGSFKKAIIENYHIFAHALKIHEYDPNITGKDAPPLPADIVVCTDVLEHVEPQCTQATLRHIASLAKQVAVIGVCVKPATKSLPDGRNAHINIRQHDWWYRNIKKYFKISDYKEMENNLIIVGEAL